MKSVMHGRCDARPTVRFPAAECHRPLAGTKLYCLVIQAHGCEQLADRESNPQLLDRKSDAITVTSPSHPFVCAQLELPFSSLSLLL